jgi:hypothetical protein
LFMTVLAGSVSFYAVPQSGMSRPQEATPVPSTGKIGAAAAWQPPPDFLSKAHMACDKGAGAASFGACLIAQMEPAGAPAAAVSFTRMLFQQNGGLPGIMIAFKSYGTVDAAQVFYPMRANDNYGLLLLNGEPLIIDVDDVQKLDRATLEQDAMFQSMKQRFPKADVWPGDRSSNSPWPRFQAKPGGGSEFIVSYPIINGCHACEHIGVARFAWEFDARGKFLRTTYIPTPPPPKLLPRPHAPIQQQPPNQSKFRLSLAVESRG